MTQLIVFIGLLAFQQVPVQEQQRVDFVLVDVAAFDRKGNAVTDLTMSDFEVKENKKEVKLTFFDVLDYRQAFELGIVSEAPTGNAPAAEPSEKPLQQMAIVLDFEMYHIEEILGAFDHLLRFFENLSPEYRYQIMVYSMDKGILTDGFEESVENARIAIERYRDHFYGYREKNPTWDQDNPIAGDAPKERPTSWVEKGVTQRGWRRNKPGQVKDKRGNERIWDREFNTDGFERMLKECMRASSPCECITQELEEFLVILEMRTEGIIDRLQALTYRFDDTSDLKTMYFVSPGFVLEDVTALYDIVRDYEIKAECGKPNATAFTGTDLDRSRDEIPRRRKLELKSDFREVVHACVRNRVMFNTIHFHKGTYLGDSRSEFVKRNAQGLLEMAEKTGGNFHATGDLKQVLEDDLPRNRFFYVLGYDSTKKGRKGQYRRISVKTKRSGVTLRYRDGYYVY